MKKRSDFQEKYGPWAVVTGASDGIGRAFASSLAERGMNLVLVARRENVLNDIAAELSGRHGIRVQVIAADLSLRSSWKRVMEETRKINIGMYVAAAGFGTSGLFTDSDLSTELQMIDVNCSAVTALARHFAPRFVQRGKGALVFLSSITAFQGVPYTANYAATKGYIQTFAEGLYRELKPRGVDVIASAPATVNSGFAARAGVRMSRAAAPEIVAEGTLKALGKRTTVRPGFLAKFLETALKMPRTLRTRMMQIVMGGMTAHQRAV